MKETHFSSRCLEFFLDTITISQIIIKRDYLLFILATDQLLHILAVRDRFSLTKLITMIGSLTIYLSRNQISSETRYFNVYLPPRFHDLVQLGEFRHSNDLMNGEIQRNNFLKILKEAKIVKLNKRFQWKKGVSIIPKCPCGQIPKY